MRAITVTAGLTALIPIATASALPVDNAVFDDSPAPIHFVKSGSSFSGSSHSSSAPSRSYSPPPARTYSPPPARVSAPPPPRSFSPPPARTYTPPPPPAASRPVPAPSIKPYQAPPEATRPYQAPPAATKPYQAPPEAAKPYQAPPAVNNTPVVPSKTANSARAGIPANVNPNIYPRGAINQTTTTRTGKQTTQSRDANGKVIGTTVTDRNGHPTYTQRKNENGETVSIDHKKGIQKTVYPDGHSETRDLYTNQVRTTREPLKNGVERVPCSRNGQSCDYVERPTAWGRQSTQAQNQPPVIIHQYEPTSHYFGSGCDLFCIWMISSMANHNNGNYNNGGYNGGGSYNGQQLPKETPPFQWGSIYPNLPADLKTKPAVYTDPIDFVGDSIVYGEMNEARALAGTFEAKMNSARCWRISKLWGCTDPKDMYSKKYLDGLRNFSLDSDTTADQRAHTSQVLESIKANKTISVKDLIDENTGVVKAAHTYMITEKNAGEIYDESSTGCALSIGDLVRTKSSEAGSSDVKMEIVRPVSDEDGNCKAGTVVVMGVPDVSEMESNFANRVESALISSRKQMSHLASK